MKYGIIFVIVVVALIALKIFAWIITKIFFILLIAAVIVGVYWVINKIKGKE